MPPDPPALPPRLTERLDALRWPESFSMADAEVGAVREYVTIGERRVRVLTYSPETRTWPLGEEIVDAILDTVGPHAAALLRRRVILLPPAKGAEAREDAVRVRRVPKVIDAATSVDLVWAVDVVTARALLWPLVHPLGDGAGGADRMSGEEILAGRLRLVHLFDWSCSVIEESGTVKRTTLRSARMPA